MELIFYAGAGFAVLTPGIRQFKGPSSIHIAKKTPTNNKREKKQSTFQAEENLVEFPFLPTALPLSQEE